MKQPISKSNKMSPKRENSPRRKLESSSHLSYLKGMRVKITSKKTLSTHILKMKKGRVVINR